MRGIRVQKVYTTVYKWNNTIIFVAIINAIHLFK